MKLYRFQLLLGIAVLVALSLVNKAYSTPELGDVYEIDIEDEEFIYRDIDLDFSRELKKGKKFYFAELYFQS